jgi:hypothetical protein
VSSLGLTTFGVGGVFQVSGSVTVEAGGLTVNSGGLTVVGTTQLRGTASIAAIDADVNAATFQVYASSASATGDVIAGRVNAAATGNVLTLLEGGNVLFNVSAALRPLYDCPVARAFLRFQVGTDRMTRIPSGGLNEQNALTINSGGLVFPASGVAVTGTTTINNGALSVTNGATNTATMDAYASDSGFSGNAILTKLTSGSFNGNAMTLLAGTGNILYQVHGTGLNTANGGLDVTGGMTVTAGGMHVYQGMGVTGDVSILSGSLSITSASNTASVLDVHTSSTSFTGNTILGRVSGGTGGNAFYASAAGNPLFQVMSRDRSLCVAGVCDLTR